MKLCAVQIPYGHTVDQADASVDFLIRELNQCDSSCDLILTPEYSNAPATFPPGGVIPYARKATPKLIEAARAAAVRCQAIVAVNYLCEIEPGVFRNTTRVFDRSGNIAGDFYKQHLPVSEICGIKPDISYTQSFRSPEIIIVDGIRLGFLICYDTYFTEYIAHLAYCHPDIVLVSSFQRAERQEVLRMLNQNLAFTCNSFVLRASVSMGQEATVAGSSMAVSPDGTILGDFGSRTGCFSCEIGDPHYKYMRSNSFGGKMISNDLFVEQGRTPWSYRPCGSMTVLPEKMMPYPRICAHRGFKTVAPENTLPAFGAAIALGAPEIELDVRFTRDGIPIVCHDDRLDRVSDGVGLVQEFTFDEIRELDAGAKFSPRFAGTKIPSFEEVLAKFARHAIMNLHIKSASETYPAAQFRIIVELLKKYDQMQHVYLMGSAQVMKTALEIAPEIPRCMGVDVPGLPISETGWDIVDRAVEWRCGKVQLFKPYFNQKMIDQAHSLGILCNVFWSDDPEEAAKFFEMGADTILTNDYLAVAQVKKSCGKGR
ncbi:MAG: hypothetical protein J5858_08955 [Lentisphaeria bacterium]|nr:hypothetical protein [Lentisphaeria bacterium]